MTTAYGNRIKVNVTTVGTGTASLGSAVTGYKDLSSLTSGSLVGYALDDGANWEVGTGTYTSGTPSTLSRDTVESSTSGGSKISLSGSALLMVTLTAAQTNNLISNSITLGRPAGGALTVLSVNENTTLSSSGLWSSFNVGKQLLITTPSGFSNPGIGITDSTQSNLWAIINAGGALQLAQMPAYSDSTTGPTTVLALSTGTVAVTGALTVSGSFPVAPDVGRNKIHNSTFTIQQRGVGSFTTNGYTADRWQASFVVGGGGGNIVTMPAAADADRTAIGDEEVAYVLQNLFSGTAGAGDFNALLQSIEGIRRLANKTVTVSFWAKSTTGTPSLGCSIDQNFGTGGTPSASVLGNGQSVTLSTTWTQYTLTFTVASASGKTFGTNGDDHTNFVFWFSSGTTNATRAGSVGVQHVTIQIWGVQLEIGSFATPLEKEDLRLTYAQCRRFYRTGQMQIAGYNQAGGISVQQYEIPDMRALPTISASFTTNSNCSSSTLNAVSNGSGLQVFTTTTATGNFNAAGSYTATADF